MQLACVLHKAPSILSVTIWTGRVLKFCTWSYSHCCLFLFCSWLSMFSFFLWPIWFLLTFLLAVMSSSFKQTLCNSALQHNFIQYIKLPEFMSLSFLSFTCPIWYATSDYSKSLLWLTLYCSCLRAFSSLDISSSLNILLLVSHVLAKIQPVLLKKCSFDGTVQCSYVVILQEHLKLASSRSDDCSINAGSFSIENYRVYKSSSLKRSMIFWRDSDHLFTAADWQAHLLFKHSIFGLLQSSWCRIKSNICPCMIFLFWMVHCLFVYF